MPLLAPVTKAVRPCWPAISAAARRVSMPLLRSPRQARPIQASQHRQARQHRPHLDRACRGAPGSNPGMITPNDAKRHPSGTRIAGYLSASGPRRGQLNRAHIIPIWSVPVLGDIRVAGRRPGVARGVASVMRARVREAVEPGPCRAVWFPRAKEAAGGRSSSGCGRRAGCLPGVVSLTMPGGRLPRPPAPRPGRRPRARCAGSREQVTDSRPDWCAAHCPGWPLQRQRCSASRCAGRACGVPLTPETSASPAGLTARAGPRARPDRRAAHPLLIMPASGGTAFPRRSDRCGANARALPSGRQ
jgi:hypothetical protein